MKKKHLKILHLEDTPYDAEFVHRCLKKAKMDIEIRVVDTEKEYLQALNHFRPEVILSDHAMPGFDSHKALDIFLERKMNIPFILVTGAVSEEFAVKSLKKGADDYILKSNLTRLPTAIKRTLVEKQTEKERDELIVKLKKSLREKDVMLKEIHHRVKNNLAVIASLLNLQATTAKDDRLKVLLRESENRVLSMSMIHEMLYRQKDFSKIPFDVYMNKLWKYLSSNYKQSGPSVDLEVRTENIHLDISTAVPCALIVNELITNAFKHAFEGRKEGKIDIEFQHEESGYRLSVKDNGIGIPPNAGKSSLGLSLIYGLAEQIGGSVKFKSNGGTSVCIRFPVRDWKEEEEPAP